MRRFRQSGSQAGQILPGQCLGLRSQAGRGRPYSVETRASSIDAIEAFRSNPQKYDLVISDMTLPKMMGDELARQIKAIRPDIPVILCSGVLSYGAVDLLPAGKVHLETTPPFHPATIAPYNPPSCQPTSILRDLAFRNLRLFGFVISPPIGRVIDRLSFHDIYFVMQRHQVSPPRVCCAPFAVRRGF